MRGQDTQQEALALLGDVGVTGVSGAMAMAFTPAEG